MKIVKLEKDRVKVILSESDLKNMNIDAGSLSPTSPELSPFLCEIMDAVKAETGFSLTDGRVIVEASLSNGGIVLILSHHGLIKSKPQSEIPQKRSEYVVFEFLSPDHLFGMIKNVSPVCLLTMRLYSYNSKLYLAIPKRKVPFLIYEYSFKNRVSPMAESTLSEHGDFLAGGYRLMRISSALKKMN